MKNIFKFCVVFNLLLVGAFFVNQKVEAVASTTLDYQTITLESGWNVISTPKVLLRHEFSVSEISNNFDIYLLDPAALSGWKTMQEAGQTEFQPLFAYFINNKTGQTQTLKLNYNFDLTPTQRLFQRTLQPGWNAIGIASPDYAISQGATRNDTNNPDKILHSFLVGDDAIDSVIDFTNGNINLDSPKITDTWLSKISTDMNALNDFRELKGYGVFVTKATNNYNGSQNLSLPAQYTLIYTAGANGSIAGTSSQTVTSGSSGIAVTAVPASGYHFVNWSDGSTVNPRTDTDVASDINVTANFGIGSGSLTLVKSASYGSQTTAAGRDIKIGQYNITAAQYDAVNISSMTVKVTDAVAALATDMSNLYIKYSGSGVTGTISSPVIGSITTAVDNVFSVPVTLPASGTLTVEVWAMVNTTAADADAADTSLAITATRATDGGSANKTAVTGQRITIKNGALAVYKASDTPVAGLVVGATNDVLISKFTWSANYEPFTVTDIKIEATTSPSDTSDDYSGIYLKYKDAAGQTVTSAIMTMVNGTSTFTNQTLYVPANSTAYMEVYGNMNGAGAGAADSGDRPQLGLYYYKATSGSTSSAEVTYGEGISPYGNQMALYASKPTVSLSGATSGTLSNGTMSLYAATIAADAQGAVGLKKLTFSVSPSMTGGGDTIGNFTLYRGTTDITDLVTIRETTSTGTNLKAGNLTSVVTGVNVVVVFTDEEEISAGSSQTYTLKAAVAGVGTVGESITTYLLKDSSYVAPAVYDAGRFSGKYFVWTDQSVLNHSELTADWNNSYLVKTLDSPSYTIQK